MAKYAQIAKRLQTAINKRSGLRLLINTQQWFSEDKQRPVTCYVIKQQITSKTKTGKDKKVSVELFRSYSHVQLVLWLRDFWYEMNGWEVPHDNEMWEEIKRNYAKDGKPTGEEDPQEWNGKTRTAVPRKT
jgi:hypothetical protein